MKRTLDLEDVLTEPLEIMGWYLDAVVDARVEADQDTESFDAHGPFGVLRSYKTDGEMTNFEVTELLIDTVSVCQNKSRVNCFKIDPKLLPLTVKIKFDELIEATIIKRAKQTPEHQWSEVEDYE